MLTLQKKGDHVLALDMLAGLQHLASTPAPPLPPSHTLGGCVRMPATAGAFPGRACTKKLAQAASGALH